MGRHHRFLLLCFCSLLVAACGPDATESGETTWNLDEGNANANGADNTDQENQSPLNDDANQAVNQAVNQAANQADNSAPSGVVPEAFIGQTWYAVLRVTDEPVIAGIYSGVEFVDEDTVRLHADTTREGSWAILENEDLHLYDIEPGPNQNQPEQWILQPELDGDQVVALDAPIPANGDLAPYRLRFEPQGPSQIPYADLVGRWQSTEQITNEEGNSFYVANRFNDDNFIEFGFVGANNNFVGFSNGTGLTHTYGTGETFWAMIPDGDTDGLPLAGEVREVDGDYRLYFFFETYPETADPSGDEAIEPELVIVEFVAVDQFASDGPDN